MTLRELRQLALESEASSDAREHWHAFFRGDWILIDQFDRDGRRYLIAERRLMPDAIAAADWELLAARARGAALKVIAADSGLSESSVCRRLKHAMRRLGVRTQAELARLPM